MKNRARIPALFLAILLLVSMTTALADAPPKPNIRVAGETVQTPADAIQEIIDASQIGYSPLQDAIITWIKNHIGLHLEGGYIVSMPDFSNARRGDMPAYNGEPPADYLPQLAVGLFARVETLPVGTTIQVSENGYGEGLTDAIRQSLAEGQAWLAKLLADTKAYQALTRMAFDYGEDAAVWKKLSVTEEAQRPRFSSAGLRKTLSDAWSGVRVREAQTALAELGYWSGDDINGVYSKELQAAVTEFEADNGLPEDGLLDDTDLRVLYDEPMPWTLTQISVADGYVPSEQFGTWWDAYLYSLRDIHWDGAVLTYTDTSASADFDTLYRRITAAYSEGEVPYDAIVEQLAASVYTPEDGESTAGGEQVTLYLDLEALAESDFTHMFVENGAARITETGLALCDMLDETLSEIYDYAEHNPAPLPFPKTGAVTKPPSGGARLKFRNNYDFPVFLRIYAVEDEWDDSTDTFLGSLFIGPKETASTGIQKGYIHLHYAEGENHWYGEELMFGDEGSYYCISNNYEMRNNYEILLWMQSPDDDTSSDSSSGYSWVGQNGF